MHNIRNKDKQFSESVREVCKCMQNIGCLCPRQKKNVSVCALRWILKTSLSSLYHFLHLSQFLLPLFLFIFFKLVFVDPLSAQLCVSHINSQTRLYKLYIKAGELDQLQRKWIRGREHWHYCDWQGHAHFMMSHALMSSVRQISNR